MYQAILFDLDGTLLDTAPDFTLVINLIRKQMKLPPLSLSTIRSAVSHGGKGLLKTGLNITPDHLLYPQLLDTFFSLYQRHLNTYTRLFPQMDQIINALEHKNIPWGIVTNKPTLFTLPLISYFHLQNRAQTVICGDTLNKSKPHPEPLWLACQQLACEPEKTIYIGDAQIDIEAGKNAGMKTILAGYGYIDEQDNPNHWNADERVETPFELFQVLRLC